MLKTGNRRPLTTDKLPPIPKAVCHKQVVTDLLSIIRQNPSESLYKAFTRLIRKPLILFFVFCLVAEIIGIFIPFILKDFINQLDHLVRTNQLATADCKCPSNRQSASSSLFWGSSESVF